MFDLESELSKWKSALRALDAMDGAVIEELEIHLRDEISALTAAGLNVEEAYLVAKRRLGHGGELSGEFSRATPSRMWSQRVFWMVLGFLDISMILLMIGVIGRLGTWIAASFADLSSVPLWAFGAHALGTLLVAAMIWVCWRYVICADHGDLRDIASAYPVLFSTSILFFLGVLCALTVGANAAVTRSLPAETMGSLSYFGLGLRAIVMVGAAVVVGVIARRAFAPPPTEFETNR